MTNITQEQIFRTIPGDKVFNRLPFHSMARRSFYHCQELKFLNLFQCPSKFHITYSMAPSSRETGGWIGDTYADNSPGSVRTGYVCSTWSNGWFRMITGYLNRTAFFPISSLSSKEPHRLAPNFFSNVVVWLWKSNPQPIEEYWNCPDSKKSIICCTFPPFDS